MTSLGEGWGVDLDKLISQKREAEVWGEAGERTGLVSRYGREVSSDTLLYSRVIIYNNNGNNNNNNVSKTLEERMANVSTIKVIHAPGDRCVCPDFSTVLRVHVLKHHLVFCKYNVYMSNKQMEASAS